MRNLWFVAAAALAAVLWILSSRPIAMPVPTLGITDKILHAIAFGTLAALVAAGGLARGWRRALIVAIVVATAYGVVDEIHQSHVPGRDASVADWIADLIGAVLGARGASALATRVYGRRRHGDRT